MSLDAIFSVDRIESELSAEDFDAISFINH